MDIGIAIILILAALAFGVYLGNASREKPSDEVKRRDDEISGLRLLLASAQEQVVKTENQLRLQSGEYQEQIEVSRSQLSQAVLAMDRTISMFPFIETTDSLMARMTPEDFKKLDLPFAFEFQAGMTQLAGQKMEAIVKLNELGLRLAFGMHYLKQTGATIAPSTKYMAEVLLEQLDLLTEYAPKMQVPGFEEQFAGVLAINMKRIGTAYLNGEEGPDEKLVARFIQAGHEVSAKIQAEAEKAEGLPSPEQPPSVSASPEVLRTPPPVNVDILYGSPPRPSSNGNGSHKEKAHERK